MLPGFDVVIVPRRELLDAEFSSLEADYRSALRRRARGRS
jgi:RNase P protein component